MSSSAPPGYDNSNISTIYEKLDDGQRKKINAAIIRRDPPTIKGILEKFKLTEAGVSYDVLYRYARKVRDQADKLSLIERTLGDEIDLPAALDKHIKRHALEILMHRDPSMLDLHRAALALHKCLQVQTAVAAGVPAGRGTSTTLGATSSPRHADGTPLSHEELMRNLNKLANRIYGVSLPGYTEPVQPNAAAPVGLNP